ncbi:MAG: diaminopimelate epimerase [Lewinellaceae bacterium]|nr:diaminopimelate epimerase [Saprospiraceae bacterium]MCB9345466.1 diaminopimelate epimerase [Lewinellaceae bacterium]
MNFKKYQGAGNDFIMLDQRQHQWITRANTDLIEHLCDRRFGIGADGLILLQNLEGYDFEMVYFNSDGHESTMCGNGGRCIVAFAYDQGISKENYRFMAIDGEHEAIIKPETGHRSYWVELKMKDIQDIEDNQDYYVLDTGSPHVVQFVNKLDSRDMVAEGRQVRYSERFKQEGINVNLVEENGIGLNIRTYERGVEDETLACGTGVTAAAIARHLHKNGEKGMNEIPVKARGGNLSVRFQANGHGKYSDIWLCGPATFVFEGDINLLPNGNAT